MKTWWKEAVVYQVYPRSFQSSTGKGIGDINGITSRLNYLKELGIDVIWLSPVYASPNIDGGYDISDYQQIHPEFGTIEDFDTLLRQAHLRGIKIIMDLVVNHTSDQHIWFVESKQGKESSKRDWYIWREPYKGQAPNQLQSIFSGSAWEWDENTSMYYMHLFAKEQPDLNWDNSTLRKEIYSMMKWWLDKGIDGFRMDVISLISKSEQSLSCSGGEGGAIANGPNVHAYLKEMNRQVLSRYDIMTVGETIGVTMEQAERYANLDGSELSMVFQFELMEADNDPVLGKWTTSRPTLPDVKRIMTKWQTGLEGKAWNSLFWSNHDQPRAVSRFGDASTPLYWEKSGKMLATCLHMLKGTPYIYQGEELGMTNTQLARLEDCRDIETFNAYREWVTEKKVYTGDEMLEAIRVHGRDNARTPMQWTGEENAGFSKETPWIAVNPNYIRINAESQLADLNSIFHYYKRLIELRKKHSVMVYGTYELLLPNDEKVYAFKRKEEETEIIVFANFTNEEITYIPLSSFLPEGSQLLIGNYTLQNRDKSILLPYEARAYITNEKDVEV